MKVQIHTLPALTDNYIYSITWENNAVVIDPAEAQPVLQHLQDQKLTLHNILCTHHHADHVDGVESLVHETGAIVAGPHDPRIPSLMHPLTEPDTLQIGPLTFHILNVPAHTSTHIAYHLPQLHAIFTGDSLFTGGCGRLFEGTPEEMHHSLQKLAQLPPETLVYCGHEYTLTNLKFALTIEPNNTLLQQRLKDTQNLRKQNQPTIPSTIQTELDTNPFLRTQSTEIQENLKLTSASPAEIFAEIRRLKDNYA